jgi:hypothetical protein
MLGGTFGLSGGGRLGFPTYSESGIGKQVHSPYDPHTLFG